MAKGKLSGITVGRIERAYRAASQIRLDDDGRILDDDLVCVSCGYNLRGLSPDGACPECGTAVGRSTHGNRLRFCDPGWVGQLASGIKFLIASIALSVLLASLSGGLTSALGVPTLVGAVLILILAVSLPVLRSDRVLETDHTRSRETGSGGQA